jgi:hypothetical protein
MATLSSDSCKLWRVGIRLIADIVSIPLDDLLQEEKDDDNFHCCVNNQGTSIVIMRGTFNLEIFAVDTEKETFVRKDKINLKREIIANRQMAPGFEFDWSKETVFDLRYTDDSATSLRLSFSHQNQVMQGHIRLADNVTELIKAEQWFDDVGIFSSTDPSLGERQKSTREVVIRMREKRNLVKFTNDNRNIVVFLNKEN